MEVSTKNITWGVLVTLVGTVFMATGLAFSETVNLVSVLGIVLGAATLAMGQIMLVSAAWKLYRGTLLKVTLPPTASELVTVESV